MQEAASQWPVSGQSQFPCHYQFHMSGEALAASVTRDGCWGHVGSPADGIVGRRGTPLPACGCAFAERVTVNPPPPHRAWLSAVYAQVQTLPQALSREVFLMTQLREGEVPHGSGHPNLLAPQFEIWFWTIRLGRPWAAGFGTARLTVYTAQYWKGGDRLLGGARAQLQGISQGRPHTFHQHLIIKKQPPLPASMFT